MKTARLIQLTVVGCLIVIGSDGGLCRAADPEFVNKAFIGENFFLGLIPNTTEWLSLQASSDCLNWTDIASVASTNNTTIIHDPSFRGFPHRFYRLRRPGFSVENAEAKWASQVNGDYQYKLSHWANFHVFTCTVTITNGQKTITEAQMDGQPLAQPDPGTFPSIGELFASLKEAQSSGCRRVAVIYDPVVGYPTWCVVEQSGQNPHEFNITEFTTLSAKTNS